MSELIAKWDFNGGTDLSGNGHDLISPTGSPVRKVFDGSTIAYCPSLTSFSDGFTLFIELTPFRVSPTIPDVFFSCNRQGAVGGNIALLKWSSYGHGGLGFYVNALATAPLPSDYAEGVTQRMVFKATPNGDGTTDFILHCGQEFTLSHSKAEFDLSQFQPVCFGGEEPLSGGVNFFKGSINSATLKNSATSSAEILDYLTYAICFPAIQSPKPSWSNKETREQANPYPSVMQTLPDESDVRIAFKQENYNSIFDQQGNQREQGYFESTVTISSVPVKDFKVMCLTNLGRLVAETKTDENGVYRFDHLLMSEKYMFIAQSNKDTKIQPDYLAVASDWQTPFSYTA